MLTTLIGNKSAVPKAFDRIAGRYDLSTSMSHGYQNDLNRSAALLELKGHEQVLDLCCGTGRSSSAILPYLTTGTITCVDNSAGMLHEAKNKFAAEIDSGRITLSLQDAMHLDMADHSFDAVFIAYGLRNMPDYGKFIEGVYRILKPGGKLVIHDYSMADSLFSRAYWFVLGYGFIVPFCTLLTGSSRIFTYLVQSVLRFLSPGEIKGLLQSKGFGQVTVHEQPNWRKPILHSFRAYKPV